MKMMNLLKRIFCKHTWKMTRWHWTHGYTVDKPYYMEVEYKCTDCGKVKYWNPPSDLWVYFSPSKFVNEDGMIWGRASRDKHENLE